MWTFSRTVPSSKPVLTFVANEACRRIKLFLVHVHGSWWMLILFGFDSSQRYVFGRNAISLLGLERRNSRKADRQMAQWAMALALAHGRQETAGDKRIAPHPARFTFVRRSRSYVHYSSPLNLVPESDRFTRSA